MTNRNTLHNKPYLSTSPQPKINTPESRDRLFGTIIKDPPRHTEGEPKASHESWRHTDG